MPLDDSEIGIDKQKIIREIAQPQAVPSPDAATVAGRAEEKPEGPSIWSVMGKHSDQIASLVTLVVAFLWVLTGVMVRHPIPVAVGAVLVAPGAIGLARALRRR